MTGENILEATSVVKHFVVGGGVFGRKAVVKAVDGVTIRVRRGETFAIVGESGCGKSTLARILMRLLDPTSGEIAFENTTVTTAQGHTLQTLRRDMQFVFQDPFSSLNPRMTVGKLVGEPLEVHAPELNAASRREKVAGLLRQVGLRAEHAGRYPHEFSGGQRQRIGIARALACSPKLIIGDEPVSALDVSVQAQVINLLGDLSRELGLTLVIIAHDLGVIRHMADRVAVMYLGRIVETGPASAVFSNPRHPYTQALLSSIPGLGNEARKRTVLTGEMPSPMAPPPGCGFHTRCPFAQTICKTTVPELSAKEDEHAVACHLADEIPEEHVPTKSKPLSGAAQTRFALYRAATEGSAITHTTPEVPNQKP